MPEIKKYSSQYYYNLIDQLPNDGTCFQAIMALSRKASEVWRVENNWNKGAKVKIIANKYGDIILRDYRIISKEERVKLIGKTATLDDYWDLQWNAVGLYLDNNEGYYILDRNCLEQIK